MNLAHNVGDPHPAIMSLEVFPQRWAAPVWDRDWWPYQKSDCWLEESNNDEGSLWVHLQEGMDDRLVVLPSDHWLWSLDFAGGRVVEESEEYVL